MNQFEHLEIFVFDGKDMVEINFVIFKILQIFN